jgi:hypothetical protein
MDITMLESKRVENFAYNITHKNIIKINISDHIKYLLYKKIESSQRKDENCNYYVTRNDHY